MVGSTQGRLILNTQESYRAATKAASWGRLHSPKPSPSASRQVATRDTTLCYPVTHGSRVCGVHLQKWRKAISTGCQATCIKNSLHSEFCGFLAIWAAIKFRANWDRGVSQTSLHIPYFYHPFLWKQMGDLEVMDCTWLWNSWLIPVTFLWKQILEEAIHRVLNKFNS